MAEIKQLRIPISDDSHAVVAAQNGHRLARESGFSQVEQTAISTAILEVARNIFKYAGTGEIRISLFEDGSTPGILIIAEDHGPGIADIELAMTDGYSTGKSLGMGLPGARRLMDHFEIESSPETGTYIQMKKWKHD